MANNSEMINLYGFVLISIGSIFALCGVGKWFGLYAVVTMIGFVMIGFGWKVCGRAVKLNREGD